MLLRVWPPRIDCQSLLGNNTPFPPLLRKKRPTPTQPENMN